ncbi:MAG: NYN domain-containing protein [Thermoleophilia bacterium]
MRPNYYSAYAYIDANYIRSTLKQAGQPGDFDPSGLWPHLNAYAAGRPVVPSRMFFYDAIDEAASEDQRKQLQTYLEMVEEISCVAVVTGFVRAGKRKRREQKGVDVQIAVDALEAALSGRADAIVLVAGDADFCPLAEAVRRAGAFMLVFGYKGSMSRELRHSADVVGYLPDPEEGHLKPF